MAQPGGFNPKGEDWIAREFAEMRRELRELKAANPFAAMGIKPMPDGLVVEGYETVNGPLEVNGESEFNGSLSINGPLHLQPGSIENDALTSPISVGRASEATTGFAVTVADQTLSTTTIPIPAGYTQALVFVVCNVGALNPTANDDFLYSKAVINGVGSREVFGYVANNNGSVAVTTAKSDLLTELSGGVITCAVTVSAGAAWTAKSANRAYVEAQAIFLR